MKKFWEREQTWYPPGQDKDNGEKGMGGVKRDSQKSQGSVSIANQALGAKPQETLEAHSKPLAKLFLTKISPGGCQCAPIHITRL